MSLKDQKFVLYDRDAYFDLYSDDVYRSYVLERLQDNGDVDYETVEDLPDEEVRDAIYADMENDFESEISDISDAFSKTFREAYPYSVGMDGQAQYALLVSGSSKVWNPTAPRGGHEYYYEVPNNSYTGLETPRPPFENLIMDSNGILKDCQIDSIWNDRAGTLHVRGVHHDGWVNFAVRAVPVDTEEEEQRLLEAYYEGFVTKDEVQDFVEKAWNNGINADMDRVYGYQWPLETAKVKSRAASEDAGTSFEVEYQLLDRLKSDCDYYLGAVADSGCDMVAAQDQLWAGSIEGQLDKMWELYNAVPEKPEWLCAADLDDYRARMIATRASTSRRIRADKSAEQVRSTAKDFVKGVAADSGSQERHAELKH